MKSVRSLIIRAVICASLASSADLPAQGLARVQSVGTASTTPAVFVAATAGNTAKAPLLAARRRVPLLNLDFSRFTANTVNTAAAVDSLSPGDIDPQDPTVVIDSVNGSESNPGTLAAPKKSLRQPAPNGSVFGLCRGSLFPESLPFSNLGITQNILVEDIASGSSDALPIISALDPVPNAGIVANGDGTYFADWLSESGVANDGYQNVYVVEINTATEAASPVASRRRMTDVGSAAALVSTPGSVYVQPFGTNHWLAQFHPSDSLAPGSGSYRYEVVSRFCPANWGGPTNTGDGSMSGLMLVGSSWGYGELGGPPGFVGDRLAFLHCTTHCAVIGGGSLQRSVFYEAGDPTTIQLAWYTGTGAGLRWNTNRCLFYANVGDRAATCLIAHTSGGSNFDRGDLSDTAFLGARWSDGSLHGTAIDYVNVATGVIERVYVQAIGDAFGVQMPTGVEIRNSVFRQVHNGDVNGYFHDNIVLAESGSDAAYLGNRYPIGCVFQNNANASNNLFWARGLATGLQNDDTVSGIQFYNGTGTRTGCSFQRNILVLNPASTNSGGVTYLNPGGADLTTTTIDYNLVINLAKGGVSASVGPAPGQPSWSSYVAYEATLANPFDQHSLYVDLSTDPRGLQAVFMDPDNGDFRWAQTDVGQQCANYCQTNNVGPAAVSSAWPVVPTVDQAIQTLSGL